MIKRILLIGCICLGALSAWALDVPALTQRVTDLTQTLGQAQISQVSQAIHDLEQATGGQMVVLMIGDLPPGTVLEEYAIAVAQGSGIGHKGKDNGALLLIVKNSRQMRLEIGYGWEGPIPDAAAGRIIRSMIPALRQGNYSAAMITAVRGVKGLIIKDPSAIEKYVKPQPQRSPFTFLIVFGLIAFYIWLSRRYPTFFLFIMINQLIRDLLSSRGGGGFGGGGFSGGGGSFGGGGASGRW